jgi:hypothetical protein
VILQRLNLIMSADLTKTDEVLRPFLLACETKQVKLVVIAIGCIQKLITFNAIPEVVSGKNYDFSCKNLQATNKIKLHSNQSMLFLRLLTIS